MSFAQHASANALSIAKQGYLFVGGTYEKHSDGMYMSRQAYVEYYIPEIIKHRFPIVMIEGGFQSGSNYTGTPDGRMGWAEYFVTRGYSVYVMDQPGRGRSALSTSYGNTERHSTEWVEKLFTAPEKYKLWPQAAQHSQWPGTGLVGDPVFDQFYAEQLPSIEDFPEQQSLNRDAGAALLDKIGPAIVLVHSQAGAFGWLIADARPSLVQAIVAVEPSGPPVHDVEFVGAPTYFKTGAFAKPNGLAAQPLHYDGSETTDLSFVEQTQPDAPNLVKCWRQTEPPRALSNLRDIPVVIISSDASYHATFDHCTSQYLAQASVKNTFIRLADRGIIGNGHMMMLEKNSLAIAAVIAQWLQDTLH